LLTSRTGLTAYDCLALGEFGVQNQKDDLAEAWYNLSLTRFDNIIEKYQVHKAWALLLAKNKQLTEAFQHFENKPEGIVASNEVIHFEGVLATTQNCTAVVTQCKSTALPVQRPQGLVNRYIHTVCVILNESALFLYIFLFYTFYIK